MDALTWFKSVFRGVPATSDRARPDVATEPWPDVPLHLGAARLRPSPAPADGDEDWDAVIARARMQAASPKAPSPPPYPPLRDAPAKAPSPPPPSPARPGSQKAPVALPFPPPRHASPEMQETPPPTRARQATPLSMARLKALRGGPPATARANLDLVAWGDLKKLAGTMPARAARRPAEEDRATPPPVGQARRAAGPLFGPAKRS